jgi:hypothetical protein
MLDYQQKVENMYKKKEVMLEIAHKKITQVLENQYLMDKMNLTEAQKRFLAQAKVAAEEKMAKERKRAAELNGQRQLIQSVGSSLMTVGMGALIAGTGGAAAIPMLAAGGALTAYGVAGK